MCAHHHEHHEGCGCHGNHSDHGHHGHHEHCGCGAAHHHDHHHHHGDALAHPIFEDGKLNEAAAGFLHLLHTHRFLPCARFVVKSEKEPSFSSVALAPVFLSDGQESVDFLRKAGEVLLGLEYHGYISIDYDIPLKGFDYRYFTESQAYQLFQHTVEEGRSQPGFLGDTATIELGSIAPLEQPESP